MTTTEALAQHVYFQIEPILRKEGLKGDILITIAIIGLIIQLITLAWRCWQNTPGDSLAKCRNPNFIQKLYLKRLVRKVLRKEWLEEYAEATVRALLAVGKTITQQELGLAIIEAHGDKTAIAKAAEYGVL